MGLRHLNGCRLTGRRLRPDSGIEQSGELAGYVLDVMNFATTVQTYDRVPIDQRAIRQLHVDFRGNFSAALRIPQQAEDEAFIVPALFTDSFAAFTGQQMPLLLINGQVIAMHLPPCDLAEEDRGQALPQRQIACYYLPDALHCMRDAVVADSSSAASFEGK